MNEDNAWDFVFDALQIIFSNTNVNRFLKLRFGITEEGLLNAY